MAGTRIKFIHFLNYSRIFLLICGLFFLLALILSATTLPYWGLHWLGTSRSVLKWKPETIILMGGSGMPSESNLMRSWYTAHAWKSFPESKILIAMPGDTKDSSSTPSLIANELVIRGISGEKIAFENHGTNTRSQALECSRLISKKSSVLLVTSPEYMRRSVMTFRKAGFEKVNALPAFENAAEASFTFEDDSLGGNKVLIPDVGKSISFRYQIWNHLKYEIMITREFVALGYYRLRGWI